jgi:2'-5' RNA ligase
MKKHRIFIAVQIPEKLKKILNSYLKPFLSNSLIRVPKKENWHITVCFCGYLNEEEINLLKGVVEEVVKNTTLFQIAPEKIIWAPPLKAKRMIWLLFENSSEFVKLKRQIEDKIFSFKNQGYFKDLKLENRKTNIHLTLARFREYNFSNLKKFMPAEGVNLRSETEAFFIFEIDIMESVLTRQGAEYRLIFKSSLRK